MTRIFDDNGNVVPITLVQVGPCTVTYIKNAEKNGYDSIQLGFGDKKKVNKPKKGHLKDLGNFEFLKEFRTDVSAYKVGDKIDISSFSEGEKVRVAGISKGKGFAGVVKRHGFHGGPASHGQKHSLREPGSIGAGGVQRVIKGKRMAGRMGSDRTNVKGLKIVKIDAENNVAAILGALPGKKGTLLEIMA